MKKEEASIGMPVHYCPSIGLRENGIIKSLSETDPDFVFVVYKCNEKWDEYMNYTGVSTNIKFLQPGWFIDIKDRRIQYITEAFSMQPITMSVTEEKPESNGGMMTKIKFIILESVKFGEEEQMMYCGYNFYNERIFQFIYKSVNVGYFPEGKR